METLEVWSQLKELVSALEKDVQKNGVKHNCSAGVRVRHGSRELARLCKTLSRTSLEADKATKVARSETPEAQARAAAKKVAVSEATPAV